MIRRSVKNLKSGVVNNKMKSRHKEHIRASKEFIDIINYIKSKYVRKGRTPPTTKEITRKLSKNINKEDLFYREFIKL